MRLRSLIPILCLCGGINVLAVQCRIQKRAPAFSVRNIIVMIPDGCGLGHATLTRWYTGRPLALDSLKTSIVHTHSGHSLITGSEAAATAFTTGYKTRSGFLGIASDSGLLPRTAPAGPQRSNRPVATVMEAARSAGKALGVVTTCRFPHATPAAFVCHWHDRDSYHTLALQMAHAGVDVLLSAGRMYIEKNLRGDLRSLLSALGIRYTTDFDSRRIDDDRPLWGLFAEKDMANDLDRKTRGLAEPSLAAMTRRAIEILSRRANGFFLMVEGSKIDWASHDNDPAGVVSEFAAFDEAVGEALRFARQDESTLLMVFSDHDNGGLTIGDYSTDTNYTELGFEACIGILRGVRLTAEAIVDSLDFLFRARALTPALARATVRGGLGFDSLSAAETKTVDEMVRILQKQPRDKAWKDSIAHRYGAMLSRRARIGWSTHGHTGTDVVMWSYGLPEQPATIDNTGIARILFGLLNINADSLNEALFTDTRTLFSGAATRLDTAGFLHYTKDSVMELTGGCLTVETNGCRACFELFTPFMRIERPGRGDTTVTLGGGIFYSAPAHAVFAPREAHSVLAACAKR